VQASYLSHPRYNKLQVMGSSAESDQHSNRNLLPGIGIKSTTERTSTNRNNTSDVLPENNTGKDVEITESTQALKGMEKYRTPKQSKDTNEYSRQVTVSVTTACSYSDFPCSYSFQLPRASPPPPHGRGGPYRAPVWSPGHIVPQGGRQPRAPSMGPRHAC
jgi:hypothetical protein